MSVQVDISPSWQDYYSTVLLLVSICFEMNHYKRISPVCQRFRPVWFSTYFTGDFKGFLITIERLRCDMHSGYDCGNCVHCQCRQVTGISKLLSLKGRELKGEIATWWRHQMETFSALLAICAGNSPVLGEFPTQRPVTRSFGIFFDLRLNKRLSKQAWGWWLEKLSRPLWRYRNARTTICSEWRMAAFCCNPLRPSDAYMRQPTMLILAQTISCRLVGAKPPSQPMMV